MYIHIHTKHFQKRRQLEQFGAFRVLASLRVLIKNSLEFVDTRTESIPFLPRVAQPSRFSNLATAPGKKLYVISFDKKLIIINKKS